MSGGKRAAHDRFIGPALGAAYVALLLSTANSLGLARDEGIYVDAARRYGAWLQLLWREPRHALQRAAIDAAFVANHEHPPLMKLLFGLGDLLQRAHPVFTTESLGFRFAGMLSAGLLLWVIYAFGARLYGKSAGLFAALAYALLPRPFYHSHLCAFDVPITLLSTATTFAYYLSLRDRRFAPLCGVVFGLALLTKHNSWLLPIIFALHFAWCALVELRARKHAAKRLSLAPYALIAMLVLGPLLFIGGWPWLWHDTLPRLEAYAAFHLHHEYYNMEYFGVNYFWPPFPSSYAWVMTLFTVPFTTLALGVSGLMLALRRSFFELRALFAGPPPSAADGAAPHDPTQATVLLLGAMLAPLVIISLPSTPIFGGTKHWFPAYPMLALFAGRGFASLARVLGRHALRPQWLAVLAGAWFLAPAAVETAHSHPFALSHYTVIAGGPPGAAEKGMNRQFWGYTTRGLVPYLRSVLPNGGALYICDTIYGAFRMLIADGHLPPSFRAVADISRADYALVHHEKHFLEIDTQIWTTYGMVQPAHVLLYDGVPIISVYKNPRR
jgi:4-amino-4-deoxy-L-arabinose transferase-like glycosyltransferase